jgi:hypothetical protein
LHSKVSTALTVLTELIESTKRRDEGAQISRFYRLATSGWGPSPILILTNELKKRSETMTITYSGSHQSEPFSSLSTGKKAQVRRRIIENAIRGAICSSTDRT